MSLQPNNRYFKVRLRVRGGAPAAVIINDGEPCPVYGPERRYLIDLIHYIAETINYAEYRDGRHEDHGGSSE